MSTVDAVATLGWVLLVAGWSQRRRRARHLACVLPGIAVDLGVVVHLELTRSVIERTVATEYEALQQIHIAASTTAVLLYVPTIVLGIRMMRTSAPSRGLRRAHGLVAVAALASRTVGFAFMWAV